MNPRSSLLILALLTVSAAAMAAEEPAKVDVRAFTEVRMAFARRPDYAPYGVPVEERKAITQVYAKGDSKEAVALAAKWLERYPIDADIHVLKAQAEARMGNWAAYFYHIHFAYGLMASVTASGDGRSAETAMKVISVDEEYYLLRTLKGEILSQRLLVGNIDALDCKINGMPVTLYFDVSLPMATLMKSMEKPAH